MRPYGKRPDGRIVLGLHGRQIQDVYKRQAKDRLENVNLYMRRTGIKTSQTNSGTIAVQQNPAAGTKVPIGTVITVSFENSTGVSDR